MTYKTKLFSSQFLVDKNNNTLNWEVAFKSDDLDQQINDWVDATNNVIVNCSAPALHGEWIDEAKNRKTIIITVIVIYTPKEQPNDGQQYPEFRPDA